MSGPVVVTGGFGFLGLHVCRALVLRGVPTFVLDLCSRAAVNRATVESFDLCSLPRHDAADPEAWETVEHLLHGKPPAAVIHLAAETHVDRSLGLSPTSLRREAPDAPVDTFCANAAAAARVASWCSRRGVRLVHLSTDEVLGDRAFGVSASGEVLSVDVANEEDAPKPPGSPYAASKVAAEAFVAAAIRSAGLDAVVVRPTNLYGPGQSRDKLVPVACARLAKGEPVPLYGNGEQVRQWVRVEEVAELVVSLAVEKRSVRGVVHAPGPRALSNRRLVAALAARAVLRGVPVPAAGWVVPAPDRPGHDLAYGLDGASSRRATGWAASRDICDPAELDGLLAEYGREPVGG